MKKIVVVLSMVLFLACFADLHAEKRTYLTAGLGRTFLVKPEIAKDWVYDGWHASLGTSFDFTSWLAGNIVGEYHFAHVKKRHGTWFKEDVTAKVLFLWMKLSPITIESRFAPYGFLGVGYVYADSRNSAGAVTFGLGLDSRVTDNFGIFIEGRYVETDPNDVVIVAHTLKIGATYLLGTK